MAAFLLVQVSTFIQANRELGVLLISTDSPLAYLCFCQLLQCLSNYTGLTTGSLYVVSNVPTSTTLILPFYTFQSFLSP